MINNDQALAHLLDLLAIDGQAGEESQIIQCITEKLLHAGCDPSWITTDDANKRLGDGFEIGNLIVQLPGTLEAPRILFSAHLDTVPLCKGVVPVVQGRRIVSQGNTGLGADDRNGCAAMVTLIETILTQQLPYPPITLLFPIAEENGLHGSKMVRIEDLGHPTMGFNLDGQDPNEVVIGAMSAARWVAKITGRSSHAGLEPHKGISAGLIASKAMTAIADQGYFGRIENEHGKGTSNLGGMHGGEANNQVMDKITLTGECRSHDPRFLNKIIHAFESNLETAAQSVTNEAGTCGSVQFVADINYNAFKLNESEPCVQIASQAIAKAGLQPNPLIMDAGLDANNFNEKNLPTVTLGAGAHQFHTVDEYVEIDEYLIACTILLNIVQSFGTNTVVKQSE